MNAPVFKLRGTGEMLGTGMLKSIKGINVAYRAEIAPIGSLSFQQSLDDGVAMMHSNSALVGDGPYFAVGYSLGCCVITEFLRRNPKSPCRGAVLIANPFGRKGIAGWRPIPTNFRVAEFAIPDDPIASLPQSDGLRAFASAITGIPQTPQLAWLNPGPTIASAWRYTVGGRHTAYGVEKFAGQSTYVDAAREQLRAWGADT